MQKALYLDLHAYQHHVFMDWRFVDDRRWGMVNSALGGAGLESMQGKWDEMFGGEEVTEETKVKKTRKKATAKKAESGKKSTKKTSAGKKVLVKASVTTKKAVRKEPKATKRKPATKKTSTKKPATKMIVVRKSSKKKGDKITVAHKPP